MADRPEVPPLRLEARRAEESPAASGPASPIERDANILRALEEANAGMEESRAPGAGERPVAVPEAAPHAVDDVGEGQTQRPRHFGALSQRQTSRSTGRHSSLTKRENAPRATARTTSREQPPATSAQSTARRSAINIAPAFLIFHTRLPTTRTIEKLSPQDCRRGGKRGQRRSPKVRLPHRFCRRLPRPSDHPTRCHGGPCSTRHAERR